RDEGAVAQHVRVASRLLVRLDPVRNVDQSEDPDEDEKGECIQQEEERERARMRGPCDRTRNEPAECDAEVHRHALLREGGVAPTITAAAPSESPRTLCK